MRLSDAIGLEIERREKKDAARLCIKKDNRVRPE